MIKFPAFYCPTNVGFLDDDRHYPHIVKLNMPTNTNIIGFFNPDEFIETINEQPIYKTPENDTHLLNWLENNAYENHISVAIVDYQLEDRSGLEVLKEISKNNVKKVLASNFVEPQIINEAYKEGLIDAFVSKMDTDFPSKLYEVITKLKYRYFAELTQISRGHLKASNKLNDDIFCEYLYSIIKKHEVTHFISNERLNLFIFKTKHSENPIYLHVFEDQDFEDTLNSLQAENADPRLLERIKNKIAFPCFSDGILRDGGLWSDFIRPLKMLQCRNNLYTYSHFEV